MAYCSRCGVEVEARAEVCPLCDAPIQRLDPPEPEAARYPALADDGRPARRLRSLIWGVGTALLASTALVCVTVDGLMHGGLTWSRPTLAGLAVAWGVLTLMVRFARRPIVLVLGQAVASTGFLVVLDSLDGRLDWFVGLGLPIVGVVTAALGTVWLGARLSRRPGTIIAPVLLAAGAAACVGIDLLVSGRAGAARMSWSLVVLAAVAGPVVLLLYVHVRVARRVDLARILHS